MQIAKFYQGGSNNPKAQFWWPHCLLRFRRKYAVFIPPKICFGCQDLMPPHNPWEGMKKLTTHAMQASRGHTAGSQADLQMAWERGKETGLAFIVIKEWGWGEESHLWAGLTWFQLPASTKAGSTKAFLSTGLNLGQKAGAWKFLNVKHQKWNQTLYCNSCLMFDWWWIYAMFHLIKFILFKYAIMVL